jgi:hypothetical protein
MKLKFDKEIFKLLPDVSMAQLSMWNNDRRVIWYNKNFKLTDKQTMF